MVGSGSLRAARHRSAPAPVPAQTRHDPAAAGATVSVLVVLRGNSGSGKTTIARAVQQRFDRAECLVVSQDMVRRIMISTNATNPPRSTSTSSNTSRCSDDSYRTTSHLFDTSGNAESPLPGVRACGSCSILGQCHRPTHRIQRRIEAVIVPSGCLEPPHTHCGIQCPATSREQVPAEPMQLGRTCSHD
ncbi:AAA family ATPase [Nocardia sp. NPDC046763]|uniref:AAA family ATPase n=1 Tax=Nocardia sp. NPDC046763 TaxID=3155256 RepID=UPI003408AD7B